MISTAWVGALPAPGICFRIRGPRSARRDRSRQRRSSSPRRIRRERRLRRSSISTRIPGRPTRASPSLSESAASGRSRARPASAKLCTRLPVVERVSPKSRARAARLSRRRETERASARASFGRKVGRHQQFALLICSVHTLMNNNSVVKVVFDDAMQQKFSRFKAIDARPK